MLQRSLWGLLIGSCVGIGLVAWLLVTGLTAETLEGPTSPSDIEVELKVTDAVTWNPGSDYYTDVRVTRGDPYATFFWSDQAGQQSRGGVETLRSSMRWTSPDALEFDTHDGKTIRISLGGDLWRLEERETSGQASTTTLDASLAAACARLGATFAEDLADGERRANEFRRREGMPDRHSASSNAGDFDIRIQPTQIGQLVTFSLSDPHIRDGDHHYLLRADNSVERVSTDRAPGLVD